MRGRIFDGRASAGVNLSLSVVIATLTRPTHGPTLLLGKQCENRVSEDRKRRRRGY